MTIRSVGFRLQTDGKADVVNDFKEVGTAGQAAMDKVADAAEDAADRASKATDAFTQRQLASFTKQANAAKLAAAGAGARTGIDQALASPGNGSQFATVNLDRSTGAAKQSASVFSDAFAQQDEVAAAAAKATAEAEALAARAADDRAASLIKLRAALDPLSVAQAKFGTDVATADALLAGGAISTTEHASALKLYSDRLEDARKGLDSNAKADADAEAAAIRLRAAIDPLGAAQARYDEQVASHNDLLQRGKITEAEHAAAVTLSGRALNEVKNDLEGHTGALSLNRTQTMIAQSAIMRFSDSVMAGQSPLRAFALEAHKVGEVLSFDDGGVAGGLAKVSALINPVTIGITVGAAAVAAGTIAWLDYSNALLKLQALSQGSGGVIGSTAQSLEAGAEAAARAGNVSVAAARDIETEYVKLGGIGDQSLSGLTALTVQFAAATGRDAKEAVQELGTAFQDPVKGAEDLTARYGYLTEAQIEQIRKLVDQNDLYGAQAQLLRDLQPSLDGAADHVNILARAWNYVKNEASDAWTAMGRAIDRAVTGGTAIEHLADLQQQRALLLASNANGAVAEIDKEIAATKAAAAADKARDDGKAARSRAVDTMKVVDSATGSDGQTDLVAKQSAINRLLADGGKAAGLNADQLARARTAQADYAHAVSTYLPDGEKAVKLAQLDAQIAAAKKGKDGDQVADLTAQRTRIEQSGKLVTAAQVEAQATAAGTKAKLEAAGASNKHAQTLAREAESMEVNARGALAVADAYLKSSAAGLLAEARRKAATDATKKGIDVDEQARRQLNLQIAEGAASGAKSVATLNDETDARAKVNAAVAGGSLSVDQLNQALADQNAIRPLIALRDAAEGDAKTKLATIIDAYTAALARSHEEEAKSGLDKDLSDSRNRALEIRAQIEDLAKSPLDQKIDAAGRAAQQEAFAKYGANSTPEQRAPLVRSKEDEALAGYQRDKAQASKTTLDNQADALALSQRELELAGANDNYRTVELDKLKLSLSLRRQFPDMAQADIDKQLAGITAQDAINVRLKVTSAALSEIRSFGGKFVDDVLSPDTWSSWGNAGKTVLKDLESEFIKLALLNPLKNLINGNSDLPTLGSALSNIGSLFGGGNALNAGGAKYEAGISPSIISAIGHNATGTENWSGGMTWVNENGPEIADLPNGTRIYPAAASRQMMQGANDTGRPHVSISLDSELLTAHVTQVADARIAAAAPGITYGAAQFTDARAAKRNSRRIRR